MIPFERNSPTTLVSSEELLAFLARPESYPEPTARVERIETHISWVFLTESHAWKFKKPVRFQFLDFSSLERRQADCESEVQLNRRLAGDVYEAVVPITRSESGSLAIGGSGQPVEWCVKMKRLPAERMLDRLIRERPLEDTELEPLAEHLTRFYTQAPPLVIAADDYRAEIERHVRANLAELSRPEHGFDANRVLRVHAAQLQTLRLSPGWFVERVCDGRIIEGHGDLRPEHICLTSTPAVFDCLEFNPEFRRIDVADELAFLGMECDFLGAHEVGAKLWNRYAETAVDHPPARLLDFYRAYRACVRAKVAALRAEQRAGEERVNALEESRAYLRLADRYAARLMRPLMVVVRGLAGSGKSTLARAIADSLGARILSTDTLRKETPAEGDRYSEARRDQVYDLLLERAGDELSEGLMVVLDGTFLKRAWRERAAMLAESRGARLVMVRVDCPADVARERIAARLARGGSDSEARPELRELQEREEERDPPEADVLGVDGTLALAALVEQVEGALRSAHQ